MEKLFDKLVNAGHLENLADITTQQKKGTSITSGIRISKVKKAMNKIKT